MWPQDQEEAGSGQWPDWVSAAEKAGLEGTVSGGREDNTAVETSHFSQSD